MKRKSTRLQSPISPQSNIRKHLLRFSAILSLLILAVVWSANAAAQTYNFSILNFIGGTFSPTAKVADAPKTLNNPVSSDSTVKDLMFGKTNTEPLSVLNNTYQTLPFSQNWTNINLITANDDWSGVPGIIGYRGDGLSNSAGTDPQTVVGESAVVDVNANQTDPNTFNTGGVTEFHITNPTIALSGSGTADAPYIQLHLNTTGLQAITISYNLRDLTSTADNAIQSYALQYRVGTTGNFINVPAGYVADTTTANAATLVTPVSALLPAAVNNQAQVQVRIITNDAAGNDERVGIDDISVTGTVPNTAPTISDIPDQTTPVNTPTGDINFTVGDAETAAASLTVTATSSNQTLVPDANITLGGSGANRTINITPAANQTGTSTITVTVSDGTTTTSDTFVLTVTAPNTAPTISDTGDQSGTVGTPIVIAFTVNDAETPPANLTVTATSSNPAVAPNPTITDNGGGNRSVNISPSAPGQTTITITVTDEGGLTATDTFVLTVAAPAPMIRNVDDDGMASDTDCDAANPAFTTIQSAVNAANAGDTIRVCPGTYAEQLNINKALTLLGPNDTVNPNTGTRTAEAIIVPTSSDPLNPSFSGPIVVNLTADGITFRGFTVDGDNPSLTSGILFNGADVDAEFGIYGTETANPDAVITNNIVRNIGEIAVWITSNGQGGAKNANSLISANKVDNVLGNFGQGIRISDDAWLSVLNNVVTRVRVGIVIENYSGNTTTHPASVIGNNNVSSFRIGIRHNLHYVYGAPGFTISNNTVTSYVPSVLPSQVTLPTAYQGIRVESIQQTVNVTVSDNTLTGNRAALTAAGYTRNEGLMVTNSSNASPNIVFDGNSVTDFIRGAFNEDTPSVPTFTCNNFFGNTTGIYISAGATNGLIANNNNIFGNGFGLQNDSPALVNAENNYWGAADGPGPVGPGSGDKVSTNVDFLPFLTAPSSCAPAVAPTTRVVDDDGMASATDCNAADAASTTIQGAVNAASAGDTIKVCPGIYTENVNVNKQLTILGPNAGVDPNTGTRGAEAIVRTAVSNPVDATNCAFITDSAIVTLAADGIIFNGFTLDGDNPALTSGFVFNGADIDAYSAIYGSPTVSENPNHVLTNNIVKNIGEFGIFLNGTGGGGPRTGNSTISNNSVDNVVGLCFGQGIRIDDGAFANIEDNVATQVFSGVVVENFFTNTTPAPVVDNNQITAFGYAIYHNLHYAYSTNGFTYSGNTINSYVQANGNFDRFRGIMLESIQQQVPVTLSGNTIMPDRAALVADGYTRVDGVYITNTSTTSPNILITLNKISNALRGISHVAPAVPTVTCNNITGNVVGVYVGTDTQFGGTPSSSTNGININQNNIVGNTTFGVQNDSSFVTNAENNYWGAPDGPGPVGPGSGDKVTANVDFTPFLTAPSSCAPVLPPSPRTIAVDDDGMASATDCNAADTASTTIQGAVNAANPGDTIKVCPGTYPELVTVNKTLTINGAQSGVDARDVSRTGLPATESVVTGNAGSSSFNVTANDVTIDGFTVQGATNPNLFGFGILIGAGTSGTDVLNNIIQNNIAGISLANNSAANQTVIQGNLISNNNQPGPVSGTGIYSDQFNSGGNLTNVLINNNTFTGNDNVAILLAPTVAGAQSAITISNNTISANGNGIFLDNTTNSAITGNNITNQTFSQVVFGDGSSGININCNTIANGATNGIRIFGTGNSNFTINLNNIQGNSVAGLNLNSGSYTGVLNAENNYWGSPTGPMIASNPGGTGDKIIDPDNVVDFDPFLTAPSNCAPTAPNPGISINDVSVSEGDAGTTNATFTITLSAVSSQTVTVTVNTADNTATVANNDYQPIVNQVVTFNPGETVKTVTVLVNGDLLVEPDETFFVNLSNATNGTITDAQGVGTILNEFAGVGDGNGFEADTSPRPNGDTNILSDDVVQIRRFLNGTDTPSTVPNEFQRADSAPIGTRGDGQILSDDVVQTRRYQNGSDAKQPAGGPVAPSGGKETLTEGFSKTTAELQSPEGNPREVRVENAMGSAGQNVTVNIRVNAVGNESEYGFIVNYDSTILSNPVVGAGTAGASVRSCNIATIGQVNCSVGGFPNNQAGSSEPGIGEIAAGTNQLLITVQFTIAANAQPGTTPLTLSNVNASSDAPQLFFPTATNGTVTILAPTAANVSIGGRVLTAEGRAVDKAQVTLTDSQGQMREARSNSFGYFKFTDLQAGETYIITIRSKQYTFSPKVVNVTQDLIDVDFIALPNG